MIDLLIEKKARLKLKYFINGVTGEISGLGRTRYEMSEDGKDIESIVLEDIALFKQECTAVTTEIDQLDMAKTLRKMEESGEDMEKWNVWWHSHAEMGVFWSNTDDNTIKSHSGGAPLLISLVSNYAGKYKARLDIFPKDSSGFKKVMYSTYNLEVEEEQEESEGNEKVLERIKVLNDQAEEKIEAYEDKFEAYKGRVEEELAEKELKLQEKIIDVNENPELKEVCEDEINTKVSLKIFNTIGFKGKNRGGKKETREGYLERTAEKNKEDYFEKQ